MRDTVTNKLHSVQEQQLLEEFDQAVAKNDQAKIRELLETRLEAPDLLEDQWRKANHYVSQITDNNIDKQQALRLLEEQKAKQLQKLQRDKQLGQEKNSKEIEEERHLKTNVLQANNAKTGRDAFRTFAGYKIAQTQPYSIFEIFESQQSNRALLNAITNLIQAEQQARIQAFQSQQQEAFIQGQEEAAQQQTQAQNAPRGNGLLNIARGNKKNGKLNRLLNSKLVGKAVSAAGPEATAVLWIVKHKKLVMVAIGIGILILVAIITLFIIVLVSLVQKFTGSSSTSGTPQDVSALVTVVADIETCERTNIGTFHPPTPLCLLALRLGNIITGGPNIDLQGFINDVNRGYPHFQCGQYIWASQTYVLLWPVFPGNVGTVFQWYTQYKNTMPGYTWIDNPDSPGLVPLPYRNSRSNWVDAPANILPGDIILYGAAGGGDPGHIAIVTQVQSDSFNIIVTEANYHAGAIDLRPTNLNDGLGRGAWILGWWRKNQ